MRTGYLAALAVALTSAAPAAAQASDRAAMAARTALDLARAARSVPGAAPAFAMVVVRRGEEPVIYVDGIADTRTGAPAGPDTPFFVASLTKAYMGLMSAVLHRRGVFDIDRPLTAVWPRLKLKDADASAITFRQLLTHQAPIENNPIPFRAGFAGAIPAADYPSLLAAWTVSRKPGFMYDNLGYQVYAAALEAQTGENWRDWLAKTVLGPLRLNHSSAHAGIPGQAATHRWLGDANWLVQNAKPDTLMHAAGGLMTSPADMARWLNAQLNGSSVAIARSTFAAAQRSQSPTTDKQEGIECSGYALGWFVCAIAARRVLVHGGSYSGSRSWMAVAPDAGLGISILANSDSMTDVLGGEIIKTYFNLALDPAATAPELRAFVATYAGRVSRQLERRRRQVAERRAQERWKGWAWAPSEQERAALTGRYRNSRLGEMVIENRETNLLMSLGERRFTLEPAAPDLFGGSMDILDPPDPVTVERQQGKIAALVWDNNRFDRID